MPRILIVDDDRAIREILSETLSLEGYEVFSATNGQAAINLAHTFRPHVILMDLMMPILDGVEATRQLKIDSETNWIRVIAMSAGMNLRNLGQAMPADSMLAKPFDLDGLLADVALQLRHVHEPENAR